MTLTELLHSIVTEPFVIIFGVLSLVEIAPIKVNPWSKVLKWIGDMINHNTQVELAKISKEVSDLKKDFEDKKANDMRWDILNFTNSCRRGNSHSKDEWWHCMGQIKEYEKYTEEKGISNGVIDEDAQYLRELYHERNLKNDFL